MRDEAFPRENERRGAGSAATTRHFSRQYPSAVGTSGYVNGRRDYFASCGCGWLETGWPNEEIARRSLDNHLVTAHPATLESYREVRRG